MGNIKPSPEFSPSEILSFRGVNYGHYRAGGPGTGEVVSLENIRQDLKIMQELGVTDIRTYRLSDGLENLPVLSKEYGITTAIVTWIAPSIPDNFAGIDHALSFENVSSMTILGNEPLLRGEYTPAEYQQFIEYANAHKSSGSKIALAEPHYIFTNAPSLVENVSVLMVHIYPAWEGIPIEEAAQFTVDKFLGVREMFPDKELYLGEFGWPSGPGGPFNEANQKRYYDEVLPLLKENNIDPYIFEMFDEHWKAETNSYNDTAYEIGPHWGIYEADRQGKPAAEPVANYYGGSVVERTFEEPQISGPDDISTSIGFATSIMWIIDDPDSDQGNYTLSRNDQVLGVRDLPWSVNTPIQIAVDTSVAGEFEYKIEVSDGENTVTDVVMVSVVDPNATSQTDGLDTPFIPVGFSLIVTTVCLRKKQSLNP
jgi:exo-beta-1,3-glucanase (GH17 family)